VNTIVRTSHGLRGYNTDGKAALEVLQGLGGSLSGRRALILGAGGAARAVLYYICKTVKSIAILNRTRSKGSRLAAQIAEWKGAKCRSYGLKIANLRKEASQADLLINTLPIDVFPRFGKTLIEEELVGRDAIVLDVNYNPRSDFLAKAKLAGAKATDGFDMLIGQAALSFKLWTGRDPPIEVMREAADEARGVRGT
jgi:shikimate dehydrogenase